MYSIEYRCEQALTSQVHGDVRSRACVLHCLFVDVLPY